MVEPGYLIRKPDGEFVMVSRLIYRLAEELDGQRQIEELTARINHGLDQTLDDDDTELLLEKLAPHGLILGSEPSAPKPRPFLALTNRAALVPAKGVGGAADFLRHLFHPPVVATVLALGIAAHTAALRMAQPFDPTDAFREPAALLAVVAITLVGGLFHEFGHAAATAYGGAKPGPIGVGVYILWPAFYVELTESYAMDRRSRVRTDVGGVYFNLLLTAALGGAYVTTGNELWFWALLAQDVTIVQQFLPFMRLDGYYLACDLAGVPDLFSLVRPVWSSLRGVPLGANKSALTKKVRLFVLSWTITATVFLSWFGLNAAFHAPRILELAWRVIRQTWSMGFRELVGGAPVSGAAGILVAGLVTVQASALVLVILRLSRLIARALYPLAVKALGRKRTAP
jgi:putative peptide zinc metalloprotease protein